jgi:uncharacterized membrane protein
LTLGTPDLRGTDGPGRLFLIVAAITVAGGALRFATLSQSIWFDEAFSIRETSASFGQMLSRVAGHEGSPPLFFAVLWAWRHLFGDGAVDMRTMPALLGTLTIPVSFGATRRLIGDRAAVIVSALVASSPAMLYYSQELRMYALLILVCTVAFWAFVAVLQSPRHMLLVVWSMFSILALATHYFAAVIVAPQAVWLIARAWRNGEARRPTAAAMAPLAVASVALLVLMHHQESRIWPYTQAVLTSPFVLQRITGAGAGHGVWLTTVFQQLMVGPGGPMKSAVVIGMLCFAMFGLWLLTRAPDHDPRRRGAEVSIGLVMPGVLALIALLILRVFVQGRYFFPAWVPAMSVIAVGLASWRRRRRAIVITTCICGLWLAIGLISSLVPQLASREDVRGVGQALGVAARPRLIVIDQRYDVAPLLLYRQSATVYRQRLGHVSELDVVLMPNRDLTGYSDANRPSPRAIPGLPEGMVLQRTIKGDTFVIERYVAKRPMAIRLYPSAGSFSARWRFMYEPQGGTISSL